ncbi:hypothetical protein [Ensifer sp. LCM 4579]|uniref:hypothetical protein n=1 Tax=Ensifer sp. LCM 4579 TaxID=1848292 RepID=UPI0008DA08AB|nr:hypothetical protein [Ensifer sp. LCM 4579]OHV85809.1 hypothetical protein LCM4579_00110 [Ensifer sp. LCM 4579]
MSLAEVLSKAARSDGGIGGANWNGGPLSGLRNKIINGNFDVWQRSTNLTGTGGYLAADRWYVNGSGATVSLGRVIINHGDLPVDARARARLTAQTADDNVGIWQKIEGVRTLAGRKATLTFWHRSNTGSLPTGLRAFIKQKFGTGGTPNADVTVFVPGTIPVTTAWTKFSAVIDVPSVAGLTLGSNGDDHLQVSIENAANETFVLDIAHVSLVEGDATGEDDPFSPRHPQQELSLCQRYYQRRGLGIVGHASTATQVRFAGFLREMRATPAAALLTTTPQFVIGNGTQTAAGATVSTIQLTTNGFRGAMEGFTGLTANLPGHVIGATDILSFDAEL